MKQPTRAELDALVSLDSGDPHAVLGVHPDTDSKGEPVLVFRAMHPDAQRAELVFDGETRTHEMTRIHAGGVFEVRIPARERATRYRYQHRFHFTDGNTWIRRDPYRFLPTLGEMDLHFVGEGRHWRLYDKLGAQPMTIDGISGISFAVWAPNARRVSVIGDFNRWDGRLCPMRRMGASGIWEIFLPDLDGGELYKFEVKTRDGQLQLKLDPFAFHAQRRPETAGIVWRRGRYTWNDDAWIAARSHRNWLYEPMAIYEVHLGSWMRSPDDPDEFLGYRDLAPMLVAHCLRYGFNFIEFLPLAEHPFDGSWGYQVTGYFAPTSRFGTPDDFKFLVDELHAAGIGVIIDWVPAHFPKDAHGLRRFDGTALYEHEDPRQGEHKDWGTLIFNYGRNEVRNFLITNALFWVDEFHIDGLRVDAVASMLYLDYSRKEGEWVPNKFGGRENLEAIEFVRQLNEELHGQFPGAFTIAEESTAFTGVSRPTYVGGLGFTFKWNMGWMNDTLEYFSKDPVHRSYHHNDLTFSMVYAFTENFILPISHDEVVHGKGSLLGRMPGDGWRQFANYRLFLAYMWTHPGKKLVFMGCEYAQGREWDFSKSLDWHQAGQGPHGQVEHLLEDLGRLYQAEPALWKYDTEPRGFTWIDCNDSHASVLSYIRWGDNGDHLVVVSNFTPVAREHYRIGVPWPCFYEEVINTDSELYGGSNLGNDGGKWAENWAMHGHYHSLDLTLPPLACLVLRPRRATP
ncbi:MAG: 1,4-alpha-glucan branching protein GlgB [Candidatus Sumerlaeia bacterium]|nr:1,4-alpha-glucan branching protein GlgB [Candidatus Sumerlaeia bacterium]